MRTFLVSIVIVFCSRVYAAVPPQVLVRALVLQESSGNDRAIGDKVDRYGRPRPASEWAYGPLQIRRMCIEDVNAVYGTHYKARDCLGNRSLSIWVCTKYLEIHATERKLGHTPTLEDMARIWNGGPGGWRKKSTKAYWANVWRYMKT